MDTSQNIVGGNGGNGVLSAQANDTSNSATAPANDPKENLNQVINSIQKILGLIHQLYLTVSSFNAASQAPLLQRLNALMTELDNMEKLSEKCNIQVPMEVLNLIDDGKNPDEFTRDVINSCIAKNQVTKGKTDAFKALRKNLLDELEQAFPDEIESYREIRAISAAETKRLAQAQSSLPNGDVKVKPEVEDVLIVRNINSVCNSSKNSSALEVAVAFHRDYFFFPEKILSSLTGMAAATHRKNSPSESQLVAVAVDKDKGSQFALKWTIDNLVSKGGSIILLHVRQKPSPTGSVSLYPFGGGTSHHQNSDPKDDNGGGVKKQPQYDGQAKELFLPFRCFCSRKEIKAIEVLVEDTEIPKAITNYCIANVVEVLVLGTPSRGGLVRRFKLTDVPSLVMKAIPDYCTMYVIGKGKISSLRSATAPAPARPTLFINPPANNDVDDKKGPSEVYHNDYSDDESSYRSSVSRGRGSSVTDTDISYISSNGGRMSVERIMFPTYDNSDFGTSVPRLSGASNSDVISVASSYGGAPDFGGYSDFSTTSDIDSVRLSSASQGMAKELQRWKMEKQQKIEMARTVEEAALAAIEVEKAKRQAAMEAVESAQKLAERETLKRKNAEMKLMIESEGRKHTESIAHNDLRCRSYTIEEIIDATNDFASNLKIGEGGYGPVYRCQLDHTPVAIKALHPDASQGRSQFQQEVDILSRIRHPNMVLLIGACPEYGCLVYEYMANGSLDDRLLRRGNTPALSWQLRFRIAAEIATGLHFLHQTKPEPLVHRDLKPGNILLDRNFVSKISDVGLARLVPPSVADTITQYRMTQTAGTFCYIDPEYQQTGMLGTKSDIYSLGIIFLQLLTAKPPMGLTHHVQRAIEKGTFADMLDQDVPDWPVEEAMKLAKLGIQCAELRRKDRPDLKEVLLPELSRLRGLAEEKMASLYFAGGSPAGSQFQSHVSEVMSGYDSSRSRTSSTSSYYGGRS
ncbi:U-box domain-containing protein 52 [Linum grandiflorum]